MAKPITLTLTPRQARMLELVIQDYIDVTDDRGVLRWAVQMRAKLDKARSVDRTVFTK